LQVQDKSGGVEEGDSVSTLNASPSTPSFAIRMALTICTRFTDEYQLFEELGK
jgi:hypothetical protein